MSRWPLKQLNQLATISAGNPAPQSNEDFAPDGYPFVRMQDVGRYGQTDNLTETVDRISGAAAMKLKRFPKGSILVPKSGASIRLNHRAILGIDAYVVSHLAIIIPNTSINGRLLYYWLCAVDLSTVAHETDFPSLRLSDLDRIEVPCPPLPDQERIVQILDEADQLRRLRIEAERRIADLIPALFLEMFGDPSTNSKSLRKEKLYNVIKVKSGNFLPANAMKQNGKYPVYGGNGISGYHSSYMFENPVIVIGRVGFYCGAVYYTEPKSWVTDNALYVAEKTKDLEDDYLASALRFANLNQYAGQAAQPLISGNRIYPIEILIPPLDLQQEYGKRVIEVHALEVEQEVSRRNLDYLFQSLLHRAFQGEL